MRAPHRAVWHTPPLDPYSSSESSSASCSHATNGATAARSSVSSSARISGARVPSITPGAPLSLMPGPGPLPRGRTCHERISSSERRSVSYSALKTCGAFLRSRVGAGGGDGAGAGAGAGGLTAVSPPSKPPVRSCSAQANSARRASGVSAEPDNS
eukprot:scaffold80980_cov54-Phaeocystis_antarctica.AAC.3